MNESNVETEIESETYYEGMEDGNINIFMQFECEKQLKKYIPLFGFENFQKYDESIMLLKFKNALLQLNEDEKNDLNNLLTFDCAEYLKEMYLDRGAPIKYVKYSFPERYYTSPTNYINTIGHIDIPIYENDEEPLDNWRLVIRIRNATKDMSYPLTLKNIFRQDGNSLSLYNTDEDIEDEDIDIEDEDKESDKEDDEEEEDEDVEEEEDNDDKVNNNNVLAPVRIPDSLDVLDEKESIHEPYQRKPEQEMLQEWYDFQYEQNILENQESIQEPFHQKRKQHDDDDADNYPSDNDAPIYENQQEEEQKEWITNPIMRQNSSSQPKKYFARDEDPFSNLNPHRFTTTTMRAPATNSNISKFTTPQRIPTPLQQTSMSSIPTEDQLQQLQKEYERKTQELYQELQMNIQQLKNRKKKFKKSVHFKE